MSGRPPSDFASPRATSSLRVRRREDGEVDAGGAAGGPRARRPPSSSIRRPASWMRPFALVERALAPRRSHSISRRTVLASDSW